MKMRSKDPQSIVLALRNMALGLRQSKDTIKNPPKCMDPKLGEIFIDGWRQGMQFTIDQIEKQANFIEQQI